MGSFANTVFRLLLGWLQGLASVLWSALTEKGGESFFLFLEKHWLPIAGILCAIGLAADFAVYLFRWEPYKVWKTSWNRITRKNKSGAEPEEEDSFRPAGTETQEIREAPPAREIRGEAANLDRWKDEAPSGGERAYNGGDLSGSEEAYSSEDLYSSEEVYSGGVPAGAEITKAGYTVPADSPYRRPEDRQAAAGGNEYLPDARKNRRRRNRLSSFLGDDESEPGFFYRPPAPLMDKKDAYNEPVYPEKWKGNSDHDP